MPSQRIGPGLYVRIPGPPYDAQAAFVERWRAEHPEYVWPEGWTCPLCLRVIQESDQAWRDRVMRDHQREHGADWTAYEALAAAQDR